jgi:hypothetical protein
MRPNIELGVCGFTVESLDPEEEVEEVEEAIWSRRFAAERSSGEGGAERCLVTDESRRGDGRLRAGGL